MTDASVFALIEGNTADILVYLFQCHMNAQQIPANNSALRHCVKLDTGLALEINKLKALTYGN